MILLLMCRGYIRIIKDRRKSRWVNNRDEIPRIVDNPVDRSQPAGAFITKLFEQ